MSQSPTRGALLTSSVPYLQQVRDYKRLAILILKITECWSPCRATVKRAYANV